MQKNQQQVAAKAFAERWAGKGYEKGESQPFWMELIQTVLGVMSFKPICTINRNFLCK